MTLEKEMHTYAFLIDALTKAVAAAALAGMSRDDIVAALNQVANLCEQSDDE